VKLKLGNNVARHWRKQSFHWLGAHAKLYSAVIQADQHWRIAQIHLRNGLAKKKKKPHPQKRE
jgi:hypothetical protein